MNFRITLISVLASSFVILSACSGGGGSDSPSSSEQNSDTDPGQQQEDNLPDHPKIDSVPYAFVSAFDNAGRYRIQRLDLATQSLTNISDPATTARAILTPYSNGSGTLGLKDSFMIQNSKVFALDHYTGQARLLADVGTIGGTVCSFPYSFIGFNNPGEPGTKLVATFTGEDGNCSGANSHLAFNADVSKTQAQDVDWEVTSMTTPILDSNLNLQGYVGIKNQKLVARNPNFEIVSELADSPRGEVVTVTAPGSTGHIFLSDGFNIYRALPSELTVAGAELTNGENVGYSTLVQNGDTLYYLQHGSLHSASFTTGVHTKIADLDRSPSQTYNFAQTSRSLIGIFSLSSQQTLSVIDKTSGATKTLLSDFPYDRAPIYIASDQAAFINDQHHLNALLTDADGTVQETFAHAQWVLALKTFDYANAEEQILPVLVSGTASAAGAITNPRITAYDRNTGEPTAELGTLSGSYVVITGAMLYGNHLLLSFQRPDENSDLFYANLATPNSLKQLTSTPELSELPMLSN